MTPIRLSLRNATQENHTRVDDAFARFDLRERDSYREFLAAHARVLPAVETAIAAASPWPGWKPRTSALVEDLATLGAEPPPPMAFVAPSDAQSLWGLLYVLEGSKLGGMMLARQVGEGLPKTFLGARDGRWGDFLAALEQGFAADDGAGLERAVEAARAAFAAFLEAAQDQAVLPRPEPM